MHCQLTNKSVIEITGDDRQNFLQGQLTADLAELDAGDSTLACLCSAKGKTWAIAQVLSMADKYLLVIDHGCLENCLRELKKYAVFSKVDICDVSAEYKLSGIIAEELPAELHALLNNQSLPDSNIQGKAYQFQDQVIWITRYNHPQIRWVVLYPTEAPVKPLLDSLTSTSVESWEAMDIQAGLPKLTAEQSEEYVPQMMNLQALNAISFTKGCYMGQEVVARTKYLGKNKRAGAILVSDEESPVKSGATLELQLGENWRRIGTCLYSACSQGKTWIFAVLPNDLEANALIRPKEHPEIPFKLSPTPYLLEE